MFNRSFLQLFDSYSFSISSGFSSRCIPILRFIHISLSLAQFSCVFYHLPSHIVLLCMRCIQCLYMHVCRRREYLIWCVCANVNSECVFPIFFSLLCSLLVISIASSSSVKIYVYSMHVAGESSCTYVISN